MHVRDAAQREAQARSGMALRPRHGPESLALVNPVVASSEIGENLVANGPHPGGKVVDADALADQGGKIAAARGALGKIADVDRQQVHGYAAGEGQRFPATTISAACLPLAALAERRKPSA